MSDTPADTAPGTKPRRGRPPRDPHAAAVKSAQGKTPFPAPPSGAGRPKRDKAELQRAAASALAWLSAGVGLIAPVDGAILEARAERLSARLAEVATRNDALARLLLSAGTGGGWAGLAAEVATVGVALGAVHHVVPLGAATVLMPELPAVVAKAVAEDTATPAARPRPTGL